MEKLIFLSILGVVLLLTLSFVEPFLPKFLQMTFATDYKTRLGLFSLMSMALGMSGFVCFVIYMFIKK